MQCHAVLAHGSQAPDSPAGVLSSLAANAETLGRCRIHYRVGRLAQPRNVAVPLLQRLEGGLEGDEAIHLVDNSLQGGGAAGGRWSLLGGACQGECGHTLSMTACSGEEGAAGGGTGVQGSPNTAKPSHPPTALTTLPAPHLQPNPHDNLAGHHLGLATHPLLPSPHLQPALHDHAAGHCFRLVRRHPQQRPQLRNIDVGVQLRGSFQVVLCHRALQYRRAVGQRSQLVLLQALRKALHLPTCAVARSGGGTVCGWFARRQAAKTRADCATLAPPLHLHAASPPTTHLCRLQDTLEIDLLKEGEQRQLGAALVLVQRGQHARALGPCRRQDSARDGRLQGLL